MNTGQLGGQHRRPLRVEADQLQQASHLAAPVDGAARHGLGDRLADGHAGVE
jgi:hypothetical protein